MPDRVATMCDQCGQTDDHPKAHPGGPDGPTKHHDCLSVHEKQQLVGSGQEPVGAKVSAIIAACEAGTHGDDLLELILSDTLPPAEGLAHQAQLAQEGTR